MKCPNCKSELTYDSIDVTVPSMERRYYTCGLCRKYYERFVERNSIGLIKHDTIYETDKDGNYLDKWD